MALRDLLEEHDRYREEARRLIKARRDPRRARFCLLKAAELLTSVAGATTDPELARIRRQQAGQLADMAQRLPQAAQTWPASTGSASTAAAPTAPPADSSAAFTCIPRPELRLDRIAGLTALKDTLRARVLEPLRHPELAARYGIRPGLGLLLYGPPGTGKTLLAQALAGEVGAPFHVVKPSDILVRYVGDSEQRLSALFAQARSHPLSVVLIDEIEALAPSRERGQDSSGVMARLVPQLLQELDGAGTRKTNPMLLVGATNEPWSLDPALLRPGRFDLRVLVDLPDHPALAELLRLHLHGLPHETLDFDALATHLAGWSGADVKCLVDSARLIPFAEAVGGAEPRPISAADLLSAAAAITPSVDPARCQRYRAWGRPPGGPAREGSP